LKIFLATWIYEENQQIALTNHNANNRLMSYYHLSDKKAKRTLKEYLGIEETYCDLCDKKKDCKKQIDGLWSCETCKIEYYTPQILDK